MEQQYNILILNEDILNIIFIKLTPIEAQNLSQTCKSLKMIYNNLYKFNQYIPLINKTQKDYENWDSFAQLNLITLAEAKFEITFSDDEVTSISSAKNLLECIKSHL